MIVAYATDNYFFWIKPFLRSLLKSNGDKHTVLLHTRGLSTEQVNKIYTWYPKVIIQNGRFNMNTLSKRYSLDKKEILEAKQACGAVNKKRGSKLWMNITADEDRIVCLRKAIMTYKEEELFIHLDIDAIFINNIEPLIQEMEGYSVGVIKRGTAVVHIDKVVSESADIPIGLVIIRNNNEGRLFVSKWTNNITSVTIQTRRNYFWGQVAISRAYKVLKNKIKVHNIDRSNIDYLCTNTNALIWLPKKTNKQRYLKILKEEKYFA